MRWTHDATTDVAYLALRPLRADELLGPTLLLENDRKFAGAMALDFSQEDGVAVGLEFQKASRCLPAELLASAERVDGGNVMRRFDERVQRRLAAHGAPSGRKRERTH